jgi:hypothetical protein
VLREHRVRALVLRRRREERLEHVRADLRVGEEQRAEEEREQLCGAAR